MTLTATPAAGWAFTGWTGDLAGTQNPGVLTMGADRSVTAVFTQVASPSAPIISAIGATPTPTSAIVTWATNKVSNSRVDYGLTASYGSTVTDPTAVTSHALLLFGLRPSTVYHFRVTSTGTDGASGSSTDVTFQTPPDPSGFVSDDFNVCAVDNGAGAWSFIDPLGGSSFATVGAGSGEAWLEIAVPAGIGHDSWNTAYNSPRLMRPIANTDFELEVKFLSPMTVGYQIQGIFIEQDANNWLRFEFHHDGSGMNIFAAKTVNGVSSSQFYSGSWLGTPQFMRIRRQGDTWTQMYSPDGSYWLQAAQFSQAMVAAKAGVFAANAGTTAPAHLGRFDYAFSTQTPITPEDAAGVSTTFVLDTSVSGSGTLTRTPSQSAYACGAQVTLSATPAPGWTFTGWSGAASGLQNPLVVLVNQDKQVTASFEVNVAPVVSNAAVTRGDNWASVSWQTNEPATTALDYGATSSYELGTAAVAGLSTQHTVVLNNLTPQTTYYLRIHAQDGDGAETVVAGPTFATTAPVPLTIAGIQATPEDTAATISWQTNKPTTTILSYGVATPSGSSAADGVYRTSHTMTLTGLTPGTVYAFRIAATDGSGVTVQSAVQNFTTPQIAPLISVWYGDQQRFGQLGISQMWVNILGNASDPDGVQSAFFSLNGGALRPLTLGPDTRRLARTGDFNVELSYAEMNNGTNQVRIIATDGAGHTAEKFVTVDVVKTAVWTSPFTVDFAAVSNVQDVAQVVDGKWVIQNGALRSIEPWYDRLVAIGDVTWKNYEATVTITTHSFDPAGYAPPSYGAAVGLVFRWKGHSVWDNSQPSWGYWPAGAIASYQWQPDGSQRIALIGNQDNQYSFNTSPPLLQYNQPYVFKMRVQTEASGQHLYQFKMWRAADPEPPFWQHQIRNGNLADDPTHGSMLLFAHHVDASFGPVAITPLPDVPDVEPQPEPPAQTDVMVVAPHPDDDVIMAAGVVQRAVRNGQSVRVVFVTNGDVDGTSEGTTRQAEAVDGQSVLGIAENRLVFLGYPDGGLGAIASYYTTTSSQYTSGAGVSATYASRGLGSTDYHRYRFGTAGPYNWPTMVADMADLLSVTKPSHIFTTSEWDTHSDHNKTYLLVEQAVAQVRTSVPSYNPTIHVTTVWPDAIRDDAPWPNAPDPTTYFAEPPVSAPGTPDWSERESLDVPSAMQSTNYAFNTKATAISAHQTQLGSAYIGRFLHKDEFFWTRRLSGANQPPVPVAGTDQAAAQGAVVTLNGSASWDRNGDPITYSWKQVDGPTVTLLNAQSAHPTFVAPSGLTGPVVLEFELVVGDGTMTSVPDGVRIVITP